MKEHDVTAIVFSDAGRICIKNFELPPCGPDEIVVETLFTFVSPGTELRVLAGTQESRGKFPLIPGYSVVGRVSETGSEVRGWRKGDLVSGRNPLPVPDINSLWGAQASHHRYKITGYDRPVKLPPDVQPWDFVTTEVAAISWRAVTAAVPAPHETAVVIGQGMIGAFAAKWLQVHGARVIVMDMVEKRLERARKWGLTAVNGRDPDAADQIKALCDEGADMVIEASSTLDGARMAGTLLRPSLQRLCHKSYKAGTLPASVHNWPRIVFLANYPGKLEISPCGLFQGEGALVLQTGDRSVEDRMAVVEMIHRGHLKAADFADIPVPFLDAPQAYTELRDHPDRRSSLAFRWTDR